MIAAPYATINDVPILATSPASWCLTAGVQPYQRVFEVDRQMGASLAATAGDPGGLRTAPRDQPGRGDPQAGSGGGLVTLVLESPGHPRVTVQRLYIQALIQGSRPETMGVLLADARSLWPRVSLARSYNVRRRTGDYSLNGEMRIENRPLTADVAYAPWSLNGSKPWKPAEALTDVLEALVGAGGFTLPAIKRTMALEDFDESGEGHYVLQMLLSHLAGYEVTVDIDGRVRVVDVRDRSELSILAFAQPMLYGEGVAGEVSRANWRPSSVIVRFERECELRFDYDEAGGLSTTARTAREPRDLENVLPVTDIQLTVSGKKITQGAYITFDEFYAATAGDWGLAPVDLSRTILQTFWLAYSYIQNLYSFGSSGNADPVLVKRLRAVRRHWRQTFRVIPGWRDKIRSLRAYRVGIINPVHGTRAPAEVWCDYLVKPSNNGIKKRRGQNAEIGQQVRGWSGKLVDGAVAPASVTVDSDLGVIHVEFTLDPWGDGDAIAPGYTLRLPTQSIGEATRLGNLAASWGGVVLEDDFRLAVVVTCLQASPNNEGRFHVVTVTPGQAGQVLGVDVGACSGPPWAVHVGGGILTAKCAWDDAFAQQIEESFFAGAAYPKDLLVNREEVKHVAEAVAAQVYSTMLDRVEGSFSIPINPAVRVTGALRVVEHSIAPDGAARTTLILPPDMEPLPAEVFLPPSTRQLVRRLVQPQ